MQQQSDALLAQHFRPKSLSSAGQFEDAAEHVPTSPSAASFSGKPIRRVSELPHATGASLFTSNSTETPLVCFVLEGQELLAERDLFAEKSPFFRELLTSFVDAQ